MDYRERGSHTRGVYPTQYTSRKRTVRMKKRKKQIRIMQKVVKNLEERNMSMKGKVPNKAELALRI